MITVHKTPQFVLSNRERGRTVKESNSELYIHVHSKSQYYRNQFILEQLIVPQSLNYVHTNSKSNLYKNLTRLFKPGFDQLLKINRNKYQVDLSNDDRRVQAQITVDTSLIDIKAEIWFILTCTRLILQVSNMKKTIAVDNLDILLGTYQNWLVLIMSMYGNI